MNTIDMQQDSQEWIRWRGKGIGSSDSPVIMGVSPWKSIHDLWLEKTGQAESNFKPNFYTEQGKTFEHVARDIYENEFKVEMPAATFEMAAPYSFMRASFDGFNRDLGYGLEIKTPKASEIELARRGGITEKYYPQIQHLMLVSGSPFIHFLTIGADTGEIIILQFNADRQYQRRLFYNCRRFWFYVENKIEIPFKKINIYTGDEKARKKTKYIRKNKS